MRKVETSYPEGSEVAMTLIEEDRAEGMEKGNKEALVENIISLLDIKFTSISLDMKEKISKLDVNSLEEMKKNIFTYENLDDIAQYIT